MRKFELYSDGNYFPRAKKSGFGGFIKDENNDILIEYTEQIKQPIYTHSFELLGIIRGLQLAKDMEIEHIVSHCDDKTAVSRLQQMMQLKNINDIPENGKPELYNQILELSNYFKSISFKYIPRTENKHSDSLSRRYAFIMGENFLNHFNQQLNQSENVFNMKESLNKKIFFSHPNIVRIEHKHNPFLVSGIRNKKVRKVSKQEVLENYKYLFVETVKSNDSVIFTSFLYDEHKNKKQINQSSFNFNEDWINNYCVFLANSLSKIKSDNLNDKLWIHNNSRTINNLFEQKDKIKKNQFEFFKLIFNELNNFSKVMFNNFPFEHEFSPEIEQIEKQKKIITENIESIDSLTEQIQSSLLDRDKKKAFGSLIKHHLRNYKNLLERDLNDIEKANIIEKTTSDLLEKGFTDIPVINSTVSRRIRKN